MPTPPCRRMSGEARFLHIKSTILANSTLRQADTTGLRADIFCMSGGRVGHIAHMLQDAPKMDTMENIVVVAGTNDITRERESEEEFDHKIKKGVGNLQHLMFSTNRTMTFVGPPSHSGLSPLAKRKRDRLDVLMRKLTIIPQYEFTYVPCTKSLQMENGHPTEDGTKELLTFIDATLPIIQNGKFITSTRLYDGVRTAFRYGCLHCLHHRHLNDQDLCPGCVKNLAPDPTLLTDKGDTDTVPTLEVQMSEKDNKRLSKDHSESTPSKIIKSNDGNDQ